MNVTKFSLFSFVILFFLASCTNEPKGAFNISGDISNADELTTYFDKIDLSNAMESLAQTSLKNGKFTIALPEKPEKGLYRVRIGAKTGLLLLDGTESNVSVSGDLKSLPQSFTVKGSQMAEEFSEKNKQAISGELKGEQLDKYLTEESDPLIAMALSSVMYGNNHMKHEVFSKVSKRISEKFGDEDKLSVDYGKLASMLAQKYAKEQAKYKVRVGQPAPEIASKTPDGKELKLSDLKGQVVLLDFWASWCGPCRRANPHVVKIYDKYKDQGFTVFNVSLDGVDERTKMRLKSEENIAKQMKNSMKRWRDAIAKDNLKWPYHVSDLRKWDSVAAASYGVRSIPSTFLIDRDGNLAALNPNKSSMESEIKKLL